MKPKMPWLKARLRKLGRTPAALAEQLNIAPPRVYEMIGGRRGIQPHEIAPAAEFLGWSTEELLQRLPAQQRVLPTKGILPKGAFISHGANTSGMSAILDVIRVLGTTPVTKPCCDSLLTGETLRIARQLPAFEGRTDIAGVYQHGSKMVPWREAGDLVLFEKARPPKAGDYVVIYLHDDEEKKPVMVRQLVDNQKTGKVCLRQHNPRRDTEIDAKAVSGMYRVLTWDEVLR
jgi:hypothetical protein